MRYIARAPPATPLRNDTVNNTPPCQIDPSLLEDNNYALPQERSHRPKPHPLFWRNRTEDPAAASASAVVGSAAARPGNDAEGNTHQQLTPPSSQNDQPVEGLAAVGSAMRRSAHVASAMADAAENTYPQARHTQKTADDLARQEASSTQDVGRTSRRKAVKFK